MGSYCYCWIIVYFNIDRVFLQTKQSLTLKDNNNWIDNNIFVFHNSFKKSSEWI